MIEQMNHLAQLWWGWMSAMFWQVGLLIILIATIDLLIRKWAWPQLRYALWSLILIKLVLSPALSLPSGLAPKLKPVVAQMLETAARLSSPKPAIDERGGATLPIVIPSFEDEFRQAAARSERHVLLAFEDLPAVGGPTDAAQPAGPQLGWRVYAMAVWLLGALTLGTWLFVKLRRLSKDHRRGSGQRSLPESFHDHLDRCARRLGLRRKPRVVTTASVQSPAVFGLFRPVLLMPVGYLRRLSRKDTEYMLLHELAHIKRGDLVAHGFYMLLQLVYWYNPLLWLVRKQLRHLRELCCDATVASLLKDKTVEYRQTLLEVARRFLATPAESGLGLVGLFEDSNRLIARINWLKKPIWRYRKMKNVAVVTIVLVLLACVLPMAQGQNPQAEKPTVSSEQAEEPSSPSEQTSATEQDESQTKEQLLQAKQALQAQLQQLQIDKQKLEQQLQALIQAQQGEGSAAQAAMKKLQEKLQALMQAQQIRGDASQAEMKAKLAKDIAAQVLEKVKEAKDKADKARAKASADAIKADVEAGKADAEARKAEALAKHWEQWAHSDAFKQWQKEVEKWAKEQAMAYEKAQEAGAFAAPVPNPNPRPMPVMPPMPAMPLEIDVDVAATAADLPKAAAPTPPAPPMVVPVPPEPPTAIPPALPMVARPTSAEVLTAIQPSPPVQPTLPNVAAPAAPALPATPPIPPAPVQAAAPPVLLPGNVPLLGAPAGIVEATPPSSVVPGINPETSRQVEISKGKDGKYTATTQMHFTSKVKPGSPVVIRNNLGNITLRPGKDDTCDVKTVIRAEAKTAAKAKEMVEQVGMNVQSSDDRYYLKPVKADGSQWSNLSVDLTIAVPLGVRPDIKTDLGNIELYDLKGDIKAVTNLGSVKAVNTTGDINLSTDLGSVTFIAPKGQDAADIKLATNLGDIEFIAPKDLSAKLQAETKMGSIKSVLPLNVSEVDMFRRKAEGAIGTGQVSIRMHTDMGSIRLRWQDESKL